MGKRPAALAISVICDSAVKSLAAAFWGTPTKEAASRALGSLGNLGWPKKVTCPVPQWKAQSLDIA